MIVVVETDTTNGAPPIIPPLILIPTTIAGFVAVITNVFTLDVAVVVVAVVVESVHLTKTLPAENVEDAVRFTLLFCENGVELILKIPCTCCIIELLVVNVPLVKVSEYLILFVKSDNCALASFLKIS